MRAVNLLPRDLEQERKGPSKPIVAGCTAAVLAAAVLAVAYLQASSAVGTHSADLATAQARLAAIPAPAQKPAVLSTLPQERQARVTALSSALATRVAWDRVLREVSLVLPEDVWLTSLSGETPTTAGSSTGQGLHITGFTYSQAAVARLLARLSVLPDLQQVSLSNATRTEIGAREVVQFDIGADLRAAGATS
jgi:Tfp pilus assembly protein PilN